MFIFGNKIHNKILKTITKIEKKYRKVASIARRQLNSIKLVLKSLVDAEITHEEFMEVKKKIIVN